MTDDTTDRRIRRARFYARRGAVGPEPGGHSTKIDYLAYLDVIDPGHSYSWANTTTELIDAARAARAARRDYQ